MAGTTQRSAPELLHYRPWRGTFRGPWTAVAAVARVSLGQIFRRKLFWVLYALGLMVFLLFFFGQYLLAWAETQTTEETVRVGGFGRANPRDIVNLLRDFLKLNGSGDTFKNFFAYQGYMVMVVLALAGAVLIGNDLRFGSLPFYLSKPLGRRHYLLGKALAVAVFINMMTTLPAVALFLQYGLLDSWEYFQRRGYLFFGILGYGAVLSVSLTLVLLATATWLRRTVPLIMAWTALFFFCRLLATGLVEQLQMPVYWRLIDLWNDTYLVGLACLRLNRPGPYHPTWPWAALVLTGVCLSCLTYLALRIRAVEIVR
jgi:ABC-type transport system involved in multi-copper enzyme maturation permease subunit